MDKILLIKPPSLLSPINLPLSLLCVGTALTSEGFAVRIVDVALERDWRDLIVDELKSGVLWAGLGCYTNDVPATLDLCKFIKQITPSVPVVWGGIHATLFPEQVAMNPAVDFAVIAEGENVAVDLSRALRGERPIDEVLSICFRSGNGVRRTPQTGFFDFENSRPLNYDLVDVQRYINPYSNIRMFPYQSSRGCPGKCAFCINVVTGNRHFRCKRAETVVQETSNICSRFNVDWIGFIDDNFFVQPKRVLEFARLKAERASSYQFRVSCRADYFRNPLGRGHVDEEMLQSLVSVGMRGVGVGFESGSDRVLKILKKGITVEQIDNAVHLLNGFPMIQKDYGFMLGVPGEEQEDIAETISLIDRIINCHGANNYVGVAVFTPYPKCELSDLLIEQGMFKEPDSLEGWCEKSITEIYNDRFGTKKPWIKKEHRSIIKYLPIYMRYTNFWSRDLLNERTGTVRNVVIYWPWILIICTSRIRARMRYFGLPIDHLAFVVLERLWPIVTGGIAAMMRLFRGGSTGKKEQ